MLHSLSPRASRAVVVLSIAAFAAVGGGLLYVFDPNAAGSPLPRCVFHLLTGLYCPGCGMTRALHALLHADVATAWSMNPMLMLVLPALPAMAWHRHVLRPVLPAWFTRVVLDGRAWIALLLTFGVLRNLPWPVFSWMAPG